MNSSPLFEIGNHKGKDAVNSYIRPPAILIWDVHRSLYACCFRALSPGLTAVRQDPYRVREKPSSSQPVMPPIIFFTGRPSLARRMAAFSVPLQCGPAQ